jgi:hypothetical protein
MKSLLALRAACPARGVALHVELAGGEALAGRGRANLMAQFLAGEASHLLFIGSDIGFAPNAVFRLLEADKPVIGGVYPKAPPPDGPVAWDLEELTDVGTESLRPVKSIGAGFLLIARSAGERLVRAHPELQANLGDLAGAAAPRAVMLFDSFVDPETRRYLTDSEAFCHRWRAIGGEVWADFASPLQQLGTVVHGPAIHV